MIKSAEKLKDGIFLERANILIPWKTTIENLHEFGNPHVMEEVGTKNFFWKDVWCGFECALETMLCKEGSLPHSSYVRKFFISPPGTNDFRKQYAMLKNIFISRFGKSSLSELRSFMGYEYPYTLWSIENVEIAMQTQERWGEFNLICVELFDRDFHAHNDSPLNNFYKSVRTRIKLSFR